MSPDFRAHPEFGYFCLSQSFRRKARKALLSTVAAGVIAGGFVLWTRDDPHEGPQTVVSVNEAPATAKTMSTVVRAAPATTAERLDPPASSKATCDSDNWTQVDGKCVVRKTTEPGSLRLRRRGRRSLPFPPTQARRVAGRSSAGTQARQCGSRRKGDGAGVSRAAGQPLPAQKAGRRTPRSQTAGRGPDRASAGSRDARSREDQRSARTYASSEDSLDRCRDRSRR
jgi:hypothetical protein